VMGTSIFRNIEYLPARNANEQPRSLYMDLLLTYGDANRTPVFPYKPADMANTNLSTLKLITDYQLRLAALKSQLVPTVPATKEEYDAEVKLQTKLMEQEIATSRPSTSAPSVNPVIPARRPAGMPPGYENMPPGMDMGGRPDFRGGMLPGFTERPGGVAMTLDQRQQVEAEQRAINALRLRKATEGRIFAVDLQNVFPAGAITPSKDVTPENLWAAQLSLWVQSDIVGAIAETNEQVLHVGTAVKKEYVMNSAVKRLDQISVNTTYVQGTAPAPMTGSPSGFQPPSGGSPAFTPPAGFGAPPAGRGNGFGAPPAGFGAPPAGFGAPPAGFGAPPSGFGMPPAGVGAAPAGTAGAQAPAALGNFFSTPDYDVVRYSFTVVMPSRYIELLMKNLQARNYHNILSIDMAELANDPNSMYYFGTDPVMTVTFNGQLLLLTAWERGTKGKYAPLMPVEVLTTLPMRPEDRERAPTVATPGVTPPAGFGPGGMPPGVVRPTTPSAAPGKTTPEDYTK